MGEREQASAGLSESSALELKPGHRYIVRLGEKVTVEAMKALVTQLKETAPGSGFLVVDGRASAEDVETTVQRCRAAINELLDASVLQRAAEGKPDAEEAIVEVVLEALFGLPPETPLRATRSR